MTYRNGLERAAYEAPTGRTIVKVGRQRRDGKYLVTYCFQARPIKSLIDAAKLEELKADPAYRVTL